MKTLIAALLLFPLASCNAVRDVLGKAERTNSAAGKALQGIQQTAEASEEMAGAVSSDGNVQPETDTAPQGEAGDADLDLDPESTNASRDGGEELVQTRLASHKPTNAKLPKAPPAPRDSRKPRKRGTATAPVKN